MSNSDKPAYAYGVPETRENACCYVDGVDKWEYLFAAALTGVAANPSFASLSPTDVADRAREIAIRAASIIDGTADDEE